MAKEGVPIPLLLPGVLLIGGAMGALNGFLVGKLRLPSIIVTLAMLVAWRDTLRWVTQGAWVQNLPCKLPMVRTGPVTRSTLDRGNRCDRPDQFQLDAAQPQRWTCNLRGLARTLKPHGLAGIEPQRVVFGAFVLLGALTGLAALLNAVRFSAVPSNAGLGLELKAVAAVVVGGTAITGGRGRLVGTLIGAALLGTIGTALTFAGINPFWEKAIQGAIILAALLSDVVLGRLERHRRLSPAH